MTEKEQKDRLEVYAKERFGVDLDKRKSLKNLQAEVCELDAKSCVDAVSGEPPTVSAAVEGKKDELTTVVAVDDAVNGIQAVCVDKVDAMNAYALRIWQGQSQDLPIRVRVTRIVEALKRQGFDNITALELPTDEDIKRYL